MSTTDTGDSTAPKFDSSGFAKLRPYERVAFEYRIDRKPRLLERSHMFGNPLHPSGLAVQDNFYVCNSLHSHSLRTGLAFVGAGAGHDFPPYPNEHFLLQVQGTTEWILEGETIVAEPGAQLFIPAFLTYTVRNVSAADAWVLSSYIRVDDWYGRPQAETAIAEGCTERRFLPAEPIKVGHGETQATAGLTGSRNASRALDFGPAATLAPRQQQDEQVVFGVSGQTVWHIDGLDYQVGPEDILFIPGMAPYSVRAGVQSRVIIYDVGLG